jgi:uncharacterized protein involved in cysteine biosynthesis
MSEMKKAFKLSFKMILTDPVNFVLSIFPTLLALAIYVFSILFIFRNSDRFVSLFRGYIYTADQASLLAQILTGVLIIFVFFLMSWTFIIVVGIVSAPFNSLLSSRIEQKLVKKVFMSEDQSEALAEVKREMFHTFKNELKKILFIAFMVGVAFVLNLFPLFYPVGVLILSVLFAVQFVDYCWSRHDLPFTACVKDVLRNLFPYALSGAIFLILIAVPIVNAFVPAVATSYFTVLWLLRQKRID